MLLLEAVQRIADGCSAGVIKDTLKEQFTRKFNSAYDAIAKNWYWKDLERQGEIALVPNYTTGTASVALNSRTVTISGGTVTSVMQGRYFMAKNANSWYRIASVDTTLNTLTLESPIQESSAGGLTYMIWKKFYRINSDVRLVLPNDRPVQTFFSDSNVYPSQPYGLAGGTMNEEDFIPFTIHGVDEFIPNYTTGSVSLSKNTNVVTGSGTAFMGNVFAGDRIAVGNNNYWIFRVESDTRLILCNYAVDDYNDTYTIFPDNPRTAVLTFTPNTATILRYSYISRVYNLVNDLFDSMRLPKEFDDVVVEQAIAYWKKDNGDNAWPGMINLASAKLETLRKNSDLVIKPFRKFPPLIHRGNGRGQTNRQYRMY